ncbi:hypothetical protein GQ54DRAFT_112390 [Martensiomyces pterosporus]|nr:hypothetical protein GQ54DRAFT_112390 [Martensiomyces pterosporus]
MTPSSIFTAFLSTLFSRLSVHPLEGLSALSLRILLPAACWRPFFSLLTEPSASNCLLLLFRLFTSNTRKTNTDKDTKPSLVAKPMARMHEVLKVHQGAPVSEPGPSSASGEPAAENTSGFSEPAYLQILERKMDKLIQDNQQLHEKLDLLISLLGGQMESTRTDTPAAEFCQPTLGLRQSTVETLTAHHCPIAESPTSRVLYTVEDPAKSSFATAPPGSSLTPCRSGGFSKLTQGVLVPPRLDYEAVRDCLPDNLPKFETGRQCDAGDSIDFLTRVEHTIMAARMNVDEWGPAAILVSISPALGERLIDKCGGSLPASWRDAADAFLELCTSPAARAHAWRRLTTMKMDIQRPFYDFVQEFDKYRRVVQLDPTSDETYDYFLYALCRPLRGMVLNYMITHISSGDPVTKLYSYVAKAEREFGLVTYDDPDYHEWHVRWGNSTTYQSKARNPGPRKSTSWKDRPNAQANYRWARQPPAKTLSIEQITAILDSVDAEDDYDKYSDEAQDATPYDSV